jgi:hypothetical protein
VRALLTSVKRNLGPAATRGPRRRSTFPYRWGYVLPVTRTSAPRRVIDLIDVVERAYEYTTSRSPLLSESGKAIFPSS